MTHIFRAFRVEATVDENGRVGALIGYWRDKSAAMEKAEKRGWYGGAGSVTPTTVIDLDGRFFELANEHPITLEVDLVQERDAKRTAALAKLTPEEKDLLGIKP